MKPIQNSLDSSKNSITSAQEAGNKVIKNVAHGIQNTSWMFDKFSSLLDELALAFDNVAQPNDESSSQEATTSEDTTQEDREIAQDLASQDAEIDGRYDRLQAHFQTTRERQNDLNDQEDGEQGCTEDRCSDASVQESLSLPNVGDEANDVTLRGLDQKHVSEMLDRKSSEGMQGEDVATEISDEIFIPSQAQQRYAELEQAAMKGAPADTVSSITGVPGGAQIPSEMSITDGNKDAETAPDTEVALMSSVEQEQAPRRLGAESLEEGFELKAKRQQTDGFGAQMPQHAVTNNSFQSAVRSAQTAVSQTVESVREMIKELGSVSSVAGRPGAMPSMNISLSDQVKMEKSSDARMKQGAPMTRSQLLRTMERVESTLKEIVKSRDGKSLSLRLDPPSLGSLKIDVSFKEGNLHARIVPESSQVALALRERAHELQSILRRIGMDAMQVSVTIANPSSAGQEMPSNMGNMFLGQQANAQGDEGGSERRSSSKRQEGEVGGEVVVEQEVSNKKSDQDHWVA